MQVIGKSVGYIQALLNSDINNIILLILKVWNIWYEYKKSIFMNMNQLM